eukprot:51582-Eustigmatos_ZCMA.PRE.1
MDATPSTLQRGMTTDSRVGTALWDHHQEKRYESGLADAGELNGACACVVDSLPAPCSLRRSE